jgi:L-ascorbate metabolism protein UlaG (beta-lactamase superfamily)
MTIQWFGQSFFKIETQGKVIAIDPFSKDSKAGIQKVPHFRADLLLITHEHQDHNNIDAIEGEPLIFRGPGEYEAKDIFIEGIASFHDRSSGKDRGSNTIFVIESENLRLAHFGDFGETHLSDEQEEKLGQVDILLIPVGGTFTIDAKTAAEIANHLGPKAVIPMHFKVPGLDLPLDGPGKFLKELASHPAAEEKISLKARDLTEDKTKVLLLKALGFEK